MGNKGYAVLFRQTLHVHGEGGSEHIPVFFGIGCERSLESRIDEVPVEVKRKADGRDAKLPSFQNHKEMDIFFQPAADLIHNIGLSA